jgi:hypothetical protein
MVSNAAHFGRIVTVPDDVATRVGQALHDVQVTGRRADRVKRIVALLMRKTSQSTNFLGAYMRQTG